MDVEWKTVQAVWQGGRNFKGSNESGGYVQMGEFNGVPGASPMELILMGLAGCTGIDVVMILEKKRQELTKFQISVRGKRAEDFPRVYTGIEINYELWGSDLDPKAVEQAIQLSEDKYCSASAMLSAVAKITSRYQIHKE